MNKDIFEGNWKELKGKIRQKWGKLTDDELDQARGNMDEIAGKIQKRYGEEKSSARRHLDKMTEDFSKKAS